MKDKYEELRICIESAIVKTGILDINKKIKYQLYLYQCYIGNTLYKTNLINHLFLYIASSRKDKPSRYAEYKPEIATLQVYINEIVLQYLRNWNQKRQTEKEKEKLFFTQAPPIIYEKVKFNKYKEEVRPIEIVIPHIRRGRISDYDCHNERPSPELMVIMKQIHDNANKEQKIFLEAIENRITKRKAMELLNLSKNKFYEKFNDYKEYLKW